MTNARLNELAVAYANSVVTYHEVNEHAKVSDLSCDKAATRTAYDEMCCAMNMLSNAALLLALQNNMA